MDVIAWLQNHLLPCPFKKLTGIDCPGCGFQRSMVALMKGNMRESLALYPAALPILITALFVFFAIKLDIDKRHIVKKSLYILTGAIITVSYIYKIYNLHA